MSKDYDKKKERILNKLENFAKQNNCTIDKLSLENIENFILINMKTINRSSYYTNIRIVNEILNDNENDIVISSKTYVDECVKSKDEQFFTKKEIQNVCHSLLNFQDKFIVYALWNKIMGKEYKDLLNLKISDVAEDYSYIMVNGKKVMCDDFMKYIIRGTIKQNEYYKFVNSDDLRSSDSYMFNPDSEYLIKVKPTKINKDGLNPMKPSGLQRKLTKLQEIYFDKCREKLILNGVSLLRSGLMYDMFIQEVENGKTWDIESMNEYLKMNGYKTNKNELYRIYWQIYHDSNVAVY